jgi:hypothetical protein
MLFRITFPEGKAFHNACFRLTPQTQIHNGPGLLFFVLLLLFNRRAGILTCYPSPSPLGYGLGPPNPWPIVVAKETSSFRCARLSLALRLLIPTFSLPITPPNLTIWLRCDGNAPLPLSPINWRKSLSSVLSLVPIIFGAKFLS